MKFHDELNPVIWDKENDNQMRPEVLAKLKEIANAFIEYIEIPEDAILDMVVTGSSASYNYNEFSDLDLHIIVDYDKIHEDCPLVEGYLGALKNTFNKEHDIYIHGVPVELYAEKKDQGTVHNGLYSVQNEEWIDRPQKIPPTDNDAAVEAKYQEIKEMVDKCDDSEAATELLEKIYAMRKAGLAQAGEFCTENLAFKKLRNEGCMDKLRQIKKEQIDKQLSLESYNEALQVGEAEILEWLKQRQVKVGYGFNKLSKEGTAYYMAKLINSLDENIINKIKEADFSNFNTKEFTLENKEALEAPKVVPCNSIITHLVCLYINPETNKTYNEKPTEEETLRRSIKIKMNKLYNKKTGWDRKGYYFLQKNGNKYEIVTNLGKGQHEVVITADSLQELNDILAEKLNIGHNNSKNESINEEVQKSFLSELSLPQGWKLLDENNLVKTFDDIELLIRFKRLDGKAFRLNRQGNIDPDNSWRVSISNYRDLPWYPKDKIAEIVNDLGYVDYPGFAGQVLADSRSNDRGIYDTKNSAIKHINQVLKTIEKAYKEFLEQTKIKEKQFNKNKKEVINIIKQLSFNKQDILEQILNLLNPKDVSKNESIKEDQDVKILTIEDKEYLTKLLSKDYNKIGVKQQIEDIEKMLKNYVWVKYEKGKNRISSAEECQKELGRKRMLKYIAKANFGGGLTNGKSLDNYTIYSPDTNLEGVENYNESIKEEFNIGDKVWRKNPETQDRMIGEVIDRSYKDGQEYLTVKFNYWTSHNGTYPAEFFRKLNKNESINENKFFKKELIGLPSKEAKLSVGDKVSINGESGEIIEVKPMKMSDTSTYKIKLDTGKIIWRYEEEIMNESINEDLKTIWKEEMKRDPIIDTADGPIYLQPSEDGKSIEYGTMTNTGMIVDGSVEYDFDYSLDANLDAVYDEITDTYGLNVVPEEDRDLVCTQEKEDRLNSLFTEAVGGIYDPRTILKAYNIEKAWIEKMEHTVGGVTQVLLFIINDYKQILDTHAVNKKDVYTYEPKENEYYLDRTRDTGDVITDYNLEPAQKLVDRWNESKKWSDMMKEELEPVYHYSVEDIDQRGDDFDNAEEAYEQAKEQLSKLGYEVKELNDDGEFEVLGTSTGVAYTGVIYPSNPELDEDVNTLINKVDQAQSDLNDIISKLEMSITEALDEPIEDEYEPIRWALEQYSNLDDCFLEGYVTFDDLRNNYGLSEFTDTQIEECAKEEGYEVEEDKILDPSL